MHIEPKKFFLLVLEQMKTCQCNRREMLHFIRKCEIEGVGVVQRLKYVYSFKSFLKAVNKDFRQVNEKDVEALDHEIKANLLKKYQTA